MSVYVRGTLSVVYVTSYKVNIILLYVLKPNWFRTKNDLFVSVTVVSLVRVREREFDYYRTYTRNFNVDHTSISNVGIS